MAAYGDHTAAASIYGLGTALSWVKNIALIGGVTAANIKLLKMSKSNYKDIRTQQRELIETAVDRYTTAMKNITNGPELRNAYPDRPKVARYRKVDQSAEQSAQIDMNHASVARGNDLSQALNHLNYQIDVSRAIAFDPRWLINVDLHSMRLRDLMRGRLPVRAPGEGLTVDDELEGLQGRISLPSGLFGRHVGISRGRIEAAGRASLHEEAALAESISPMSRQSDIREWQFTPEQRVALAFTQAQLIQNSLQNLFNSQAQKPPVRMARIMLRLEKAINTLQVDAAKAGLTNSFVPNYAAALQPQISAIAQGLSQGIDKMFAPSTPQSSYNTPSTGGDYQQQNASGAYTKYQRSGLG